LMVSIKLTRESAENEAHIKLQEEKIAKLIRKFKKRSTQSTLRLLTMRSNQRKTLRLKTSSPLDQ